MRALQVSAFGGPDAVVLADLPEPVACHPPARGDPVVIEVHAAGVAFPDVLLSRGLYQLKPDLPFVPGMEWQAPYVPRPKPASCARVSAWRPSRS